MKIVKSNGFGLRRFVPICAPANLILILKQLDDALKGGLPGVVWGVISAFSSKVGLNSVDEGADMAELESSSD